MVSSLAPVTLVGDGIGVPCLDGSERAYANLDCAASTSALREVADRVSSFLPWYSSVHRGAGYKSQLSTAAYEVAREAVLRFAGRDELAIFCRNTTEAINHLAYRLAPARRDVILTSVVEHHANLLPWTRAATCRFVECERDGTFGVDAVRAGLDESPRPRLLAITGASNVTGWMPPLAEIGAAARERGVPVLVDAAQLAPHRPLPPDVDFVAFSGHKMYAPFGTGALIGPRAAFESGDPFLAGGGAVDLVDLDDRHVHDRRRSARARRRPPERRVRDRGSPRLLLRASLPRQAARAGRRRAAPLPRGRPPARPMRASRGGPRVGRDLDHARGDRAPARGG